MRGGESMFPYANSVNNALVIFNAILQYEGLPKGKLVVVEITPEHINLFHSSFNPDSLGENFLHIVYNVRISKNDNRYKAIAERLGHKKGTSLHILRGQEAEEILKIIESNNITTM